MKNHNYSEKIKRNLIQDKHERFSIRKLTVGAASVLLGFTFAGISSQTVKADTAEQPSQVNEKAAASTDNAATKQPDLTTYKGLSSFLSSGKNSSNTNDNSNSAVETPVKTPQTGSVDTSATNSAADASTQSSGQAPTVPEKTDIAKQPQTAPSVTTNNNASAAEQKADTQSLDYNSASPFPSDRLDFDKTTDSTVYVGNWADFKNALTNINIHDIELLNNIQATATDENRIMVPPRKLIIRSNGDKAPKGGYIIDFRMYSPQDSALNGSIMDITYQNLQLYCQDYLGVMNTVDSLPASAKVTFDDVIFTGSQVLYSGNYTDVHIKNNFLANMVSSYKNPFDSTDKKDWQTEGWDGQQAFELASDGDKITFDKGCHAVISTSDGNVIEMNNGANSLNNPKANQVNILSGADVTLNPRINPGRYDECAQHTDKASGIVFRGGYGDVFVDNGAKLTINVGADETGSFKAFNGNPDRHRAAAINFKVLGGKITDNGTIAINTNGDISKSTGDCTPAGVLLYDTGDLNIGSQGSLIIRGTNMQNYTGTLVDIKGNATLSDGTCDIQLTGGNSAAGAGTNAITLLDTDGSLSADNPRSLILNASDNKNSNTRIIGKNAISITNGRQISNYSGISKITLPPFHKLQVGGNNINANKIELLNGKLTLSNDVINKIINDLQSRPDGDKITKILIKALGGNSESLSDLLRQNEGKNFDYLFKNAIKFAFSDKTNPSYNNIAFGPANPSGFLNIEDSKGNQGKASWQQDMKDGSTIITGKVMNYTSTVDGPAPTDNIFNNIMPCGTDAYVIAYLENSTAVYNNSASPVDNPYGNTNNAENDLPKMFTTKVNPDGTFRFKIPAELVTTGERIKLIPEANFVSFDPVNGPKYVLAQLGTIINIADFISNATDELNNDITLETQRIRESGLSDEDQKPFLDSINNSCKNAIEKIKESKKFELVSSLLNYTINLFNHEGAKAEFLAYEQNCDLKAKDTDLGSIYGSEEVKNEITNGNSFIDGAFGSDHLETQIEPSLTNRTRDFVENDLLNVYKNAFNKLLTDAKNDAESGATGKPKLNEELAKQLDALMPGYEGSVVSATSIEDVISKYDYVKKQIANFIDMNSNLNNGRDAVQAAIEKMRSIINTARDAIMNSSTLTLAKKEYYLSSLSNLVTKYLPLINSGNNGNVEEIFNQFKNEADNILNGIKEDVPAESNKA